MQFDEAELEAARAALDAEVEVVRDAMDHANLDEEHPRAWTDMQHEAIYLPSEKRYGRASVASTKDKLNSVEMRYKRVYAQMERDFKKCAKSEKKLVVLTTG